MLGDPLLAETMYLAGYIERMVTGSRDMIRRCAEAGLPEHVAPIPRRCCTPGGPWRLISPCSPRRRNFWRGDSVRVSYCKEDSLSFKFLRSTLGEYCFQSSSTAGICCYDSLSKSGGSLIISNIRELLSKGELGIDSRKREALSPFGG